MIKWYRELAELKSLGQTTKKAGSLAGLHEARKEHLSQFFTPSPAARFMWELARPAMEKAFADEQGYIAVLDNSVGTGRLLQFADPNTYDLYGVDVHEPAITALIERTQSVGFESEFETAGMEEVKPAGFSAAFINPPFSIHLDSPLLEPYPCTTWGAHGPNTAALSHAYALHQALAAADIVVALLPRTYADEVATDPGLQPQLRGVFHLPADTFKDEGANVRTTVLVFCRHGKAAPVVRTVMDFDERHALELSCRSTRTLNPRLNRSGVQHSEPSITLAVTGDNTVRLSHNGRQINIHYACGLTQAKVANAILREPLPYIEGLRRPVGLEYTGQGQLDIEVHLTQGDPLVSFEALLGTIRAAGGHPMVDASLAGYLKRRTRQHNRELTPLRKVVYLPQSAAFSDNGTVTGVARKLVMLEPNVWGGAMIAAGSAVVFTPEGAGYNFQIQGKTFTMNLDEVVTQFELDAVAEPTGQEEENNWVVVHEGREEAYPELFSASQARARSIGLNEYLNWGYQFRDLAEIMCIGRNSLVPWDTGLGKARLSYAISRYIDANHTLLVLEPHLVDEMVREYGKLKVSAEMWQVITTAEQVRDLKKVNIITYNRLRSPLNSNSDSKRTFAKALRRRCAVVIADEGDKLANRNSQQSQALWQLSPKRRYVLSATAAPNYPRDVLPITAWVHGDGTALQPYGLRRYKVEPALRNSCRYAGRGIDAFREEFVTTEWVTREWEDGMEEGAKREIPKIKDVDGYRRFLAPLVKRRVSQEPEVKRDAKIPKAAHFEYDIDWDDAHLAHYLNVADDFAEMYLRAREDADTRRKQMNLVALLARIGAVQFAASLPQHEIEGFGTYRPLTSKQRWSLDTLEKFTDEGLKSILYARNPAQLELMRDQLEERGIEAVVIHGKMPIKRRTRDLDRRFRFGPAPVLLASLGVTQTGLNIPQASEVIFHDRAWTAKTEIQAGGRVLRPEQVGNPRFHFPHLIGSIDVYMGRMVASKRNAYHAGFDYGMQNEEGEFLHLDTILHRFVEDLAILRGATNSHEFKEQVKSLRLVA
jgi:hypothetical protein